MLFSFDFRDLMFYIFMQGSNVQPFQGNRSVFSDFYPGMLADIVIVDGRPAEKYKRCAPCEICFQKRGVFLVAALHQNDN